MRPPRCPEHFNSFHRKCPHCQAERRYVLAIAERGMRYPSVTCAGCGTDVVDTRQHRDWHKRRHEPFGQRYRWPR